MISDSLVSILIPAFNAAPWVAASVESALAQTWPQTEVVVLDDGSTDDTPAVIRRFAGRARIERQENAGQNVSRNRLMALSEGRWLVYLDADDELADDAVERRMEQSRAADAVYGSIDFQTYEGGQLIRSEAVDAQDMRDPLAAAFRWRYPNTSAFMFRRSAVAEVGGWNESIRNCTDYDLYFRLLLAGKRLRAAPCSRSVYRSWNESRQASREDALRMTTTRLVVMWHAATELDRTGGWTLEAREAFVNAAMGVIRTLHGVNPARAVEEYRTLRAWAPGFRLSEAVFPAAYRAAFRMFGFRGAERLADMTRSLRARPLPAITG